MDYNTKVPTVSPVLPFMDRADAEALRAAMKGMGTDEEAIINILAHRTSYQRQIIKETYKEVHDRNLIDDLKSDLTGHFEGVMIALMTPMPLYMAQTLHKAIKGKDKNTLIEILCTRDKISITNIKKSYMEEYKTELSEDLNKLSNVRFRQFLISMITEERSEVTDDMETAKLLQQQLFDAARDNSGVTVEDEMMGILTKNSYPMLRLAFWEYFNVHDEEYQNVIDTKFPEELKGVMKTVYVSIMSPPIFFAKELNSAISGAGTDDPKLIRLVVSRAEIDMENIKEEYEKLYNKTLELAIKGDTSGDYKQVLLALIES